MRHVKLTPRSMEESAIAPPGAQKSHVFVVCAFLLYCAASVLLREGLDLLFYPLIFVPYWPFFIH